MQEDEIRKKDNSKTKAIAIYLIGGTYLMFIGIARFPFHELNVSWHRFGFSITFIIGGLLSYLLCLFVAFGGSILGGSGHEQVFNNQILQRVRDRYASEIQQLSSLGFSYVFTEGETLSIYRFFLIFPLIVLLVMYSKGEVLAMGSGGKILMAIPIYCSSDGRTFVHPFGLGVKFQSAFRNGQLLVTKNFDSESCDTPEYVVRAAKRTIPETWQEHQNWLEKLDTTSNQANRDRSYEAYATISKREEVFQKRQM